jgi:hypothetical protein
LSGNQYIYGVNLDTKFGEGAADEMVRLSREIKKFTPDELKKLIELCEDDVNGLRKKLNIWD